MTASLALKYRPASFRDIVGQRPVQAVLYRMFHEVTSTGNRALDPPRIPHGLLFDGTRGTGKTSTARIIGAALNCQAAERPCGVCESCVAVASGISPAVTEIDAASNGTVDQVRKLQEMVSYDCGAAYRLVIFDEAQSASRDAFNALLKVLEEPPPRTVFILLTTERGKILETVASRCMPFTFRRIAPDVIAQRLSHICQSEGIAADNSLLARIAEQADGGMRDAVMVLDQVTRVGISTLEQYEVLHGEADFAPYLIAEMVKGDYGALFGRVEVLLSQVGDYNLISARLTGCIRDVLVLRAGGTLTIHGDALIRRQKLARYLSTAQAAAIMKVLWDLRVRVRSSDPRSSLELAMVMCVEVLHPTQVIAAQAPATNGHHPGGNGNGKATVDDIRKLVSAS